MLQSVKDGPTAVRPPSIFLFGARRRMTEVSERFLPNDSRVVRIFQRHHRLCMQGEDELRRRGGRRGRRGRDGGVGGGGNSVIQQG